MCQRTNQERNKKFPELNGSARTHKNFCNILKAVLRRKFMALNIFSKKKNPERVQINNDTTKKI